MDFRELFFASLLQAPKGSLPDRLLMIGEAAVSRYMDACPVQDSLRFRARYAGQLLANDLIDEKGDLRKDRLDGWIALFDQGIYVLGPEREGDALIYGHLREALRALKEKGGLWTWIRKFSPPLANKKAEELVRITLWPEPIKTVQTTHVRRAVLAAWFTLLRQTTGSCFATAPAILIQMRHPVRLLRDLYDLLSMGMMKRVVAGKEYAVPLSPNFGKSDLQKPLAPFADTLHLCPGLVMALESGGLIDPDKPLEKKTADLKRFLEGREDLQTAEKLIRTLLLESLGLTEQDLEDEEHLAKMQMSPLLARQSAVYYQKPSERAQKIAEWKKRTIKACHAFEAAAECALLRSWEYTLASFCDVKVDFARWNLYVGLGLHSDQKGGVGEFLYQSIDAHLQKANDEAARFHQEYEQNAGTASAVEGMIYNALSDGQRNLLKAEWTSAVQAANAALEMRNKVAERADALSRFFSFLIQQYDARLQEGFQELFDPSLFGEEEHVYEDSPAGFRLVYKHGRADPSQWTPICSGEEYIVALREFFSSCEREIEIPPEIGEELFSGLTTGLIQFIQEPEFLASALARSREKGRQSPWHYISGGTMETLVQSYCGRDRRLTEASIVPKSEAEVLEFLLKEKAGEGGPLLIHSPTHAFLYLPALLRRESLQMADREWVRKQGKIGEEVQEYLTHRFSERLPQKERPLFLHLARQNQAAPSLLLLREQWVGAMKGSAVGDPVSLAESFLFEQLPVFPNAAGNAAVEAILNRLAQKNPELRNRPRMNAAGSFLGAADRAELCKMIVLKTLKHPFGPIDWDAEFAAASRELGFSRPAPLLFADSNWSGWFFGFAANPCSAQMELWRFNRVGTRGVPMRDWKRWMAPENKDAWVLLTKEKEFADALN